MATVWKARDTLLGRLVAIKRLLPHLAGESDAAERFKREAQAAASLSHPGIVTVFDSGEDDEGPYIVLELVEGTTLAAYLARTGPLDPGTVTDVVAQVASALDHAHSQGVVHRDIKPANLILEDGGRVRLADFGIARTIDDPATITDTGELVGTITYLAPEILAGHPATPSSDIYSLGAVTYELLSGRPPHRAESPAALLEAVRQGIVPSLTGVAPEMAFAVGTAMAKDARSRPRTAGEFAAALTGSATLVMSGAAARAAVASEEPTVITRPAPAVIVKAEPEPSGGARWSLLALLLLVLALAAAAITNDRDTDPADLASPTTVPAPTTTLAPATTVTTTPSTIPTTTTTTLATTTTAASSTPEDLAAEIGALLAVLGPPQFRNRDVRQVEDQMARVMEEWENDDREDLISEMQQTFDEVADLDESPERETLTARLIQPAELMGFEVDQNGAGDGDD